MALVSQKHTSASRGGVRGFFRQATGRRRVALRAGLLASVSGLLVIFTVKAVGHSDSASIPSLATNTGQILFMAGFVVVVAMARKTSTVLFWILGSLLLAALMKVALGLFMLDQCLDCYLSDSPPPAPPADALARTLGSLATVLFLMAQVFSVVAVTHPMIQRFFNRFDTHESELSDQMVEVAPFCGQCGSAIDATDSFCARCGHSLRPTND